MLLNASLSGLPFVGVDVGGFNENVTPELLVRWNELGIFYPFFRNHCVMTARAQEPWAFSEKIENAIRRLIQTRYQLLPYINALFWEHTRTGAPLMRPLFWHYPDDENVREIDDQFMFGENILVTPVLERSKTRRLVYFPEGRWYPFDGGSAIEGNQSRMVELPLGCVPAFIKEGTILPLVHAIQHTGDYQSAPIYFHIYGNASHGRYFEDDGSTDAYRRGHYNEYALMARNGEFAMEPLHIGLPNDGREFFVVQDSVKTAFSPFRK
jgi:alpha-glucosidase